MKIKEFLKKSICISLMTVMTTTSLSSLALADEESTAAVETEKTAATGEVTDGENYAETTAEKTKEVAADDIGESEDVTEETSADGSLSTEKNDEGALAAADTITLAGDTNVRFYWDAACTNEITDRELTPSTTTDTIIYAKSSETYPVCYISMQDSDGNDLEFTGTDSTTHKLAAYLASRLSTSTNIWRITLPLNYSGSSDPDINAQVNSLKNNLKTITTHTCIDTQQTFRRDCVLDFETDIILNNNTRVILLGNYGSSSGIDYFNFEYFQQNGIDRLRIYINGENDGLHDLYLTLPSLLDQSASHHIKLHYDGDTGIATIWVDYVNVGSLTLPSEFSEQATDSLWIGFDRRGISNIMLDEEAVFSNWSLTITQEEDLYNVAVNGATNTLDLASGQSDPQSVALTSTVTELAGGADVTEDVILEYTTSDASIATVDQAGVVTAVGVGSTTIEVSAYEKNEDGSKGTLGGATTYEINVIVYGGRETLNTPIDSNIVFDYGMDIEFTAEILFESLSKRIVFLGNYNGDGVPEFNFEYKYVDNKPCLRFYHMGGSSGQDINYEISNFSTGLHSVKLTYTHSGTTGTVKMYFDDVQAGGNITVEDTSTLTDKTFIVGYDQRSAASNPTPCTSLYNYELNVTNVDSYVTGLADCVNSISDTYAYGEAITPGDISSDQLTNLSIRYYDETGTMLDAVPAAPGTYTAKAVNLTSNDQVDSEISLKTFTIQNKYASFTVTSENLEWDQAPFYQWDRTNETYIHIPEEDKGGWSETRTSVAITVAATSNTGVTARLSAENAATGRNLFGTTTPVQFYSDVACQTEITDNLLQFAAGINVSQTVYVKLEMAASDVPLGILGQTLQEGAITVTATDTYKALIGEAESATQPVNVRYVQTSDSPKAVYSVDVAFADMNLEYAYYDAGATPCWSGTGGDFTIVNKSNVGLSAKISYVGAGYSSSAQPAEVSRDLRLNSSDPYPVADYTDSDANTLSMHLNVPDEKYAYASLGSQQLGYVQVVLTPAAGYLFTDISQLNFTGRSPDEETLGADGSITLKYALNAEVYAFADEPTAVSGLAYNGTMQTGVEAGTGYTLSGNKGVDAGTYTATAVLTDGYKWYGESATSKTINWSIADSYIITIPADQSLTSDTPQTGNVIVSECGIASGQTLAVTVRSVNGYQLMNASGNSCIPYTVTPESNIAFSGTGENPVLTISSPTTHVARAALTFVTTADSVSQAKYAGEHKDTLTFTVSVH